MTTTDRADILPAMQTRTGVEFWTPDGPRIVDTSGTSVSTEEEAGLSAEPSASANGEGGQPTVAGMTEIDQPADTGDPVHDAEHMDAELRDGLWRRTTKRDQIEFVCETLGVSDNKIVGDVLERYGITTERSNRHKIIRAWRARNGFPDTGQMQKLNDELLSEMDAKTNPGTTNQTDHAHDTTRKPRRKPRPPHTTTTTTETTSMATTHHNGSTLDHTTDVVLADFTTPHTTDTGTPHTTDTGDGSGQDRIVVADTTSGRLVHHTAAPDTTPGHTTDVVDSRSPHRTEKPLVVWPVLLMALSAFVAIWSGWVGMGEMTGFGVVRLLPGISDFEINTAITLPIGVEAYASYALYVWLSGRTRTEETHKFAKFSAFGSLALGAAGQIAYHLLTQSQADDIAARQAAADTVAKAAGKTASVVHAIAPWWITTFVACLPVVVVGMGAALAHMVRRERAEVSA